MATDSSIRASPASEFERLRPRLTGIAYRITGSWADAEDIVQDTWIAWDAADRGDVRSSVAYLTRAVGNRSLSRLRERERRREEYVGPWLPEPVADDALPEERAEIADSLSFATLVLLEQLSPLERAAFVLCDVFGVPATEAATALDSTDAAVRQLRSRARKHLRDRDRSLFVDEADLRRASSKLIAALRNGEVSDAVRLLSPEVRLISDGGGKVQAALRPIEGPRKVLAFLAGLLAKYPGSRFETRRINHTPAIIVWPPDGLPATVCLFGLDENGAIDAIWGVRNPDKVTAALR